MSKYAQRYAQQGATLIVGLIMLLLLTLMVSSAFMLSGVNLSAVNNAQLRDEATAAANAALEEVLGSLTTFTAPAAKTITVGQDTVSVAPAVCIRAVDVKSDSSADPTPNILIEGAPNLGGATGYQDTYWNIVATVSNATTGVNVAVNQGVKIRLPASPNPCP